MSGVRLLAFSWGTMLRPVNDDGMFVAKPTSSRIIAWLCITFFTFCSVMSWRAGQGEVAPWFLIFVGLGFLTLAVTGSVEMNRELISYKSLWANYMMRWDEIERIEVDAQGQALVFIGGEKRLSVLGPGYWSGKDKAGMLALLASQLKEREIPVQQTQSALFKLSKNTKVRSSRTAI